MCSTHVHFSPLMHQIMSIIPVNRCLQCIKWSQIGVNPCIGYRRCTTGVNRDESHESESDGNQQQDPQQKTREKPYVNLNHIPKTRIKTTATLDPDVDQQLTDGLHPKKHPGRRYLKQVNLPAFLELAAKKSVSRFLTQKFRSDAVKLCNRINHYYPPQDPDEVRDRERLIREKVLANEKLDFDLLTPDEKDFVLEKREKKIEKHLASRVFVWKDIEYDDRSACVYLAGRLAPNFAAISAVFYEISLDYPEFKPKTLFDFGSGMGTVMFAANMRWPNSISEHFNVDISKPMNDLSRLLLMGGDENQPMIYEGVYHRQFLPVSSNIKYDMVVSAFTLLELPSRQSRIHAIESLWHKTQDLLVIIEYGTLAGFKMVLEARNLILEMSGYDVTKSYYESQDVSIANHDPNRVPDAYVLAPCQHHLACPRLYTGGPLACNFDIPYMEFDVGMGTGVKMENYSYVVLKKGSPAEKRNSNWPRIVQPVIRKHRHTVCRTCCPDGVIRSVNITPSKHGTNMYNCAKLSKWGDLLPATVYHEEQEMSDRVRYWMHVKQDIKAKQNLLKSGSIDLGQVDPLDVDPHEHEADDTSDPTKDGKT